MFVIATANNVHAAAARAAAQGPLRRDLLLRPARSRGPSPDHRHPPAQEEPRPGPVRHGQAGRGDARLLGRRARAGGDRGALRRVRHRQRPRRPRACSRRCSEIVPLAITMREQIEDDARVGADPRAAGVVPRPRAAEEGGLDGALRRADGEPRRQGHRDRPTTASASSSCDERPWSGGSLSHLVRYTEETPCRISRSAR